MTDDDHGRNEPRQPGTATPWKPTPSPWVAGALGRCPRCGEGPLFRGMLAPREACPACGLDYGFMDAGDGPAVFAVFFAGLVVVALALWVEFAFVPPAWVHVVLWIPTVLVITVAMVRPMKGILIALQYRHKAAEGRRADAAAGETTRGHDPSADGGSAR